MADGDVERPDSVPCSHDGPNRSPAVTERDPGAALGSRLAVLSDQPGLGAPDAGAAEEDAEMGRHAEASWMSDSLPVEENEIGTAPESGEGADEMRPLAERKIAGNVGKGDPTFDAGRLKGQKVREAHNDHAGPGGLAVGREGQVSSRNKPDPSRAARKTKPIAERFLKPSGGFGRSRPAALGGEHDLLYNKGRAPRDGQRNLSRC